MNNSCATVNTFNEEIFSETPTTGCWQGQEELSSGKTNNWARFAREISIATFFAFSPITAIHDPWVIEKRRRDAVVTMSVYQEIIGRIVSRSETLNITRQILLDAEKQRLTVAEFEAARGIKWEESQ